MTLPNFLLIGAAKAGTTSLVAQLAAHPQIYMSPLKEPAFFAASSYRDESSPDIRVWDDTIRTLEAYESLFEGVTTETAIGESSTVYMALPGVAEHIHRLIPGAWLIAVLRDPSVRAVSMHAMYVRMGYEPDANFSQVIREQGPSTYWRPYLAPGLYFRRLKEYYDLFPPDQILVALYEDLVANPQATLQSMLRFLEVDDEIVPHPSIMMNANPAAVVPRSRTLERVLSQDHPLKRVIRTLVPSQIYSGVIARLRRRNVRSVDLTYVERQLSGQDRQYLVDYFRDDILQLQDLLDRDLSVWLNPSPQAC